ncbi:MAG: hypothetical protein ACRD3I_02195 [Terriglobales bacterium]
MITSEAILACKSLDDVVSLLRANGAGEITIRANLEVAGLQRLDIHLAVVHDGERYEDNREMFLTRAAAPALQQVLTMEVANGLLFMLKGKL